MELPMARNLNAFSSALSVPREGLLLRKGAFGVTRGVRCIRMTGSVLSSKTQVLNHNNILRCYFNRLQGTIVVELYSLFPSTESIKQEAVYRRYKKRLIVSATSKPVNSNTSASDHVPVSIDNSFEALGNVLDAFWRFSRPHTVIGTAIGILSVSLLAVESVSDLSPVFLIGLLKAIVPALFMNIYIVGLNQLFDVEIDKVNKPYLPLASGEYSIGTGVVIVSAFAFMNCGPGAGTANQVKGLGYQVITSAEESLSLGLLIGSVPLLWALFISLVLGTAYSVKIPFLRWKRSPMAAASCILCVRAIVVQLAFYLHIQSSVYRRPAVLTKPLIFATTFMCFFSIVIALFKDIPDVDGDRIYGIQSFSVRLGQKRVFWLCIYLLQAAYCVAMVMGAASPFMWSKLVMVLGHAALATVLWHQAESLDLKSKVAITSFYMFIWKLFYAEYLLIPFMR